MRRSIAVPIGSDGKRDAWLGRAMLGLGQAGVTISPDVVAAGMAGLATIDPAQFQMVPWAEMEPLLAAMLPSFALVDSSEPASARSIVLGDIEELRTLWRLRMEWIGLQLTPLGMASPALPITPAPAPKAQDRRPPKRRQGHGSRA
jgi:hypothetical protein